MLISLCLFVLLLYFLYILLMFSDPTNMPKEPIIFNCHTHIFTHKNVPNSFFPIRLVQLARINIIRIFIELFLKIIIPCSKNDKYHRLANYIESTYADSQEDIFNKLHPSYPQNTKFIILPMDMKLMNAGLILEDIDQQHKELYELSIDQKYKDKIIPFAHIDPRRPDALNRLINLTENYKFKGVKIYPTLGYYPNYPILMNEIYPYMVSKNIPLMTHCSPGNVNMKGIPIRDAHKMADPDNYLEVMDKYPKLKICFAHFGGINEWHKYIEEPEERDKTWLSKILRVFENPKYKNIYADISYTIFNFQENINYLKVLLENTDISSKVLFGSDYYLVKQEAYPEKRLSIDIRATLGEKLFWKIASENPRKYLGIR